MEIQETVRRTTEFLPETCWIAHVMAHHGLTTRIATNRINEDQRATLSAREEAADHLYIAALQNDLTARLKGADQDWGDDLSIAGPI